jgi:hypothetical protein
MLISNDNSVQKEIQRRILTGNRTYFAAISLSRNRLLSRATKIRLYKTLIRSVVTYGSETWTMTKKDEQVLLIFKGKYLEEYMVLNKKMGNGKLGRIETRRV